MPTYEYACKECGEHLDVVQRFTDDALTTCPGCGGPLRKVFGSIGISFKGSGFYKNDSRSATNGSSKENKDDKGAKEGKGAKDESSSSATDSSSKATDGAAKADAPAAKPAKAGAPTAAP